MTDSTSETKPVPADVPPAGAAEVVRSEERLSVSTVGEPYRRVRVRKRIIRETKTVTVEVRREELVVEDVPAPGVDGVPGVDADGPGTPIEFDLCEEQITITKVVVPVERVRVEVYRVAGAVTVSSPLSHEEVAVEGSVTRDR